MHPLFHGELFRGLGGIFACSRTLPHTRIKSKHRLKSHSSAWQVKYKQWCAGICVMLRLWISSRWVLSLCRWVLHLATRNITLLSQFYLFFSMPTKSHHILCIFLHNLANTGCHWISIFSFRLSQIRSINHTVFNLLIISFFLPFLSKFCWLILFQQF